MTTYEVVIMRRLRSRVELFCPPVKTTTPTKKMQLYNLGETLIVFKMVSAQITHIRRL